MEHKTERLKARTTEKKKGGRKFNENKQLKKKKILSEVSERFNFS